MKCSSFSQLSRRSRLEPSSRFFEMPRICQSPLSSFLVLKAILKRGYAVTQIISKGYWPKIYYSIHIIIVIFVIINEEPEQVTSPLEHNASVHLGYKTVHYCS